MRVLLDFHRHLKTWVDNAYIGSCVAYVLYLGFGIGEVQT